MKTNFFKKLLSFWPDSFEDSPSEGMLLGFILIDLLLVTPALFVFYHANLWIFPISILFWGFFNWVTMGSNLRDEYKLWFVVLEFLLLAIVSWIFMILVYKICF